MLSFENRPSGEGFFVQRVLSLTSDHCEPRRAARDVLDQLQAVPAGQWSSRFGWQCPRR
jgi:hypothetical protein